MKKYLIVAFHPDGESNYCGHSRREVYGPFPENEDRNKKRSEIMDHITEHDEWAELVDVDVINEQIQVGQ